MHVFLAMLQLWNYVQPGGSQTGYMFFRSHVNVLKLWGILWLCEYFEALALLWQCVIVVQMFANYKGSLIMWMSWQHANANTTRWSIHCDTQHDQDNKTHVRASNCTRRRRHDIHIRNTPTYVLIFFQIKYIYVNKRVRNLGIRTVRSRSSSK